MLPRDVVRAKLERRRRLELRFDARLTSELDRLSICDAFWSIEFMRSCMVEA